MALGRFGIRDVFDIVLFDTVTGNPYLKIDSMKTASTEIGAETVFSRGATQYTL